ncbi:MAG: hypothetical protein Q8Q35_03610 [Nanoarchaeota archaeon]|nr:hypothetical protein [Nanoarchaeota archaeon]
MKSEKALLTILTLFVLAIILIFSNSEITSYVTVDSNTTDNETTTDTNTNTTIEETTTKEVKTIVLSEGLDLDLSAKKFAVDAPIKGTLDFSLVENVDPAEIVTISINGEDYVYTIEDILLDNNYSIEYEDKGFDVTNAEQDKDLTFTKSGSKLIGIQLPRYSEVETLEFAINGEVYSTTYPSGVKIDIGNEGTQDWFYLGEFVDYTGDLISSEDLDTTAEGTGYIQDNNTYYCELMNLPLSKHFRISAEYKKLGTEGNIRAILLSVPTGNPSYGFSGGADYCDLPETQGSCEIELAYPIEGEYIACIYSAGKQSTSSYLYSLPLDTTETTTTSYTCPVDDPNGLCIATEFSNFFIYAEASEYENEMIGNIDIPEWETFTNAILTGIKFYVGSSPYNGLCKTSICNVPINISSASAGIITLSDLTLDYTYKTIAQSTSTFYDLEIPITNITSVDLEDLDEGASFSIDLEDLNIILDTTGTYTLEATFLDYDDSVELEIVEADKLYDAKSLINLITTNLESYLDSDSDEYQILTMLDLLQDAQDVLDDMDSFKTQIGFVEEETLLANVEKAISDIPLIITLSSTSSDLLIIEPSDIDSELGDEEEIYFMQDSIKVTGTISTAELEYYNGDISTYTYIHKEIEAQEDIEEADFYETTPDVDNLYEENVPEILTLDEGKTEDYYFLYEGELELDDFTTIIVTQIIEEEPDYECGDGICLISYEDELTCPEDCKESSFPWWIIILVAILGIGIVVLINFKDKLFKKKQPVITKPSTSVQSQQPKPVSKPKTQKPLFGK